MCVCVILTDSTSVALMLGARLCRKMQHVCVCVCVCDTHRLDLGGADAGREVAQEDGARLVQRARLRRLLALLRLAVPDAAAAVLLTAAAARL